MSTATCPLCDSVAQSFPTDGDRTRYRCLTCGRYEISGRAASRLPAPATKARRYLLSAYAKAGNDFHIVEDVLDRLGTGDLRDRTVDEKIELAVRWFADRSIEFGQKLPSEISRDYPAAWCRSPGEWNELLGAAVRLNYLDALHPNYSVSIEGWRWLEKSPGDHSPDVFVAMNFAPEYARLRQAVSAAVRNAGYREITIDQDVFSGGIMDRVLARIRRSRFVVADYTGNRGGVYYEAGFALGLGKAVVSTCSRAQLESSDRAVRLHFDVAHLKMIPWDDANLDAFSQGLNDHILALFGHGGAPVEKR